MARNFQARNDSGGVLLNKLRAALRWAFRLLVTVILLLALVVVLTPQGRTGFRTALFVLQMLEQPLKPQPWFSDEPLRQKVSFAYGDGAGAAEIYRLPGGEPRAAVLLSIGANPYGLDDPIVVRLGKALARAGYVAMLHWTPEVGLDNNLSVAEPQKLVWAFRHLEEQDYVDAERVGLGGFCVGASFALVAAADSSISDRVHFVNAFGPFYDAEELLLQVASRAVEYNGESSRWEPDALTLRVLANELIETLPNAADAEILSLRYIEDVEDDTGEGESEAEIDTDTVELTALTARGRAVARLLDGVERQEAEALYAELPASFHQDLADISPAKYVEDIHARLLVMHDRNDTLVPAAESRRLIDAVNGANVVRYTELSEFDHTTPAAGGAYIRVKQGYQLFLHLYHIIRMAE